MQWNQVIPIVPDCDDQQIEGIINHLLTMADDPWIRQYFLYYVWHRRVALPKHALTNHTSTVSNSVYASDKRRTLMVQQVPSDWGLQHVARLLAEMGQLEPLRDIEHISLPGLKSGSHFGCAFITLVAFEVASRLHERNRFVTNDTKGLPIVLPIVWASEDGPGYYLENCYADSVFYRLDSHDHAIDCLHHGDAPRHLEPSNSTDTSDDALQLLSVLLREDDPPYATMERR